MANYKGDNSKNTALFFSCLETNPGGMFAINETTGNITLVGNLDRKTRSFYALLVSVSHFTH